jgi:hypothetical protein
MEIILSETSQSYKLLIILLKLKSPPLRVSLRVDTQFGTTCHEY